MLICAQVCPTLLRPHGLEPTRLLCPWDFPGKNTGVGCHFLLQGIVPNSGTESPSPALAEGFFTTSTTMGLNIHGKCKKQTK